MGVTVNVTVFVYLWTLGCVQDVPDFSSNVVPPASPNRISGTEDGWVDAFYGVTEYFATFNNLLNWENIKEMFSSFSFLVPNCSPEWKHVVDYRDGDVLQKLWAKFLAVPVISGSVCEREAGEGSCLCCFWLVRALGWKFVSQESQKKGISHTKLRAKVE